jgi:hypothetical protein
MGQVAANINKTPLAALTSYLVTLLATDFHAEMTFEPKFHTLVTSTKIISSKMSNILKSVTPNLLLDELHLMGYKAV